jgi:hypothetical protein
MTLNPFQLIKNNFLSGSHSLAIRGSLITYLVVFVIGYVSKKIFIAGRFSSYKKIILGLILLAITNVIKKHPEETKEIGRRVIFIFRKIIGATPSTAQP